MDSNELMAHIRRLNEIEQFKHKQQREIALNKIKQLREEQRKRENARNAIPQ